MHAFSKQFQRFASIFQILLQILLEFWLKLFETVEFSTPGMAFTILIAILQDFGYYFAY